MQGICDNSTHSGYLLSVSAGIGFSVVTGAAMRALGCNWPQALSGAGVGGLVGLTGVWLKLGQSSYSKPEAPSDTLASEEETLLTDESSGAEDNKQTMPLPQPDSELIENEEESSDTSAALDRLLSVDAELLKEASQEVREEAFQDLIRCFDELWSSETPKKTIFQVVHALDAVERLNKPQRSTFVRYWYLYQRSDFKQHLTELAPGPQLDALLEVGDNDFWRLFRKIRPTLCEERLACGPGVVGAWLQEYAGQFVAHAVWPDNVEAVLASGSVKSSEQVLRETGKVSYEQGWGYGMRGEMRLPKISKESYNDLIKDYQFPGSVVFYRQRGDRCNWRYEVSFKKSSDCVEEEAREDQIAKDKGTFIVTKRRVGEYEPLIDNSSLRYDFKRYYERHEQQGVVFGNPCHVTVPFWKDSWRNFSQSLGPTVPVWATLLAVDEKREGWVDKVLTDVYQYITSKGVGSNYASYSLQHLRQLLFGGPSKLNYDVRVRVRSIAWSYGDFVVLKGQGKQCVQFDHEKRTGQEATMLAPWQNGGKLFELNLREPDVLVLAPHAVLDTHANELTGIHHVAIEELTPYQLGFFGLCDL